MRADWGLAQARCILSNYLTNLRRKRWKTTPRKSGLRCWLNLAIVLGRLPDNQTKWIVWAKAATLGASGRLLRGMADGRAAAQPLSVPLSPPLTLTLTYRGHVWSGASLGKFKSPVRHARILTRHIVWCKLGQPNETDSGVKRTIGGGWQRAIAEKADGRLPHSPIAAWNVYGGVEGPKAEPAAFSSAPPYTDIIQVLPFLAQAARVLSLQ